MSDVLEATDDALTLTDHQKQLEYLYSKNQLKPRMRAYFADEELGVIPYLEEHGIPIEFGLDVLIQMALHKRADIKTLVGILYHHFNDAQETADMLRKAAEVDLMDWSPELRIFVVRYELPGSIQEEIDRFQFPLPMVVEPRKIRDNRSSGYLLNQKSVILRDNHHEDDVCLDHLNRANRAKLTINTKVVEVVSNSWRSLDKPKEGETKTEFEKRKRAFEKYDRTAKDVIATVMAHSDHFYLTHRYDKRGRTYAMGYHVSYQGNDWNKACIEFADKEPIE
jgi:hypothetical protein